jgi:hypothetical protein
MRSYGARSYGAPIRRPLIAWEQPLWPTADSGAEGTAEINPPAASPPRSSPVSTGAHRPRRRSAQTAPVAADARPSRHAVPAQLLAGPDQERDVWMATPSLGRPLAGRTEVCHDPEECRSGLGKPEDDERPASGCPHAAIPFLALPVKRSRIYSTACGWPVAGGGTDRGCR